MRKRTWVARERDFKPEETETDQSRGRAQGILAG